MPLAINLSLNLPRDEMSVPVARHICQFSLHEVGVAGSCIDSILLALSEACTNVLDHSHDGTTDYEVIVGIDAERCAIRVKDNGAGFDAGNVAGQAIDLTAETGRGIQLMRELVDRVDFVARPEDGMVVRLEKDLEFESDNPVHRRFVDG